MKSLLKDRFSILLPEPSGFAKRYARDFTDEKELDAAAGP
jgi:hypothetical protein